MARTTLVESALTLSAPAQQKLKINGTDGTFGDWRDDLVRDGYAVVKGAIPRDRALHYADRMLSLLESFGTGYDRNDPSTVHPDKLPVINEKGMLLNYGAAHEDFVWAIRSEPGVISAFEQVYATEDLLVSFDAINYGFANRAHLPANKPDGGLIVCKGAHLLSEQFHEDMKGEERIPAWTNEWYGFTDAGMAWLKDHGGEWIKVEAEPGDLLLWDSRTPHYNVPASGTQDRLAVYTCYMPVADASQEDLVRKKAAWDAKVGTTHWPNALHSGTNVAMRNGKPDSIVRNEPLNKPVLSERAFRLTGIPYIKV
ncbi:hypothetical protein C8A01DRAFT_31693 [Parachaetomium inaequale]|uniref:Phytanoyl-CoA dioxygenase n=1 Tax=Parachaetomium inaequale TaxID=2588326 RepID=A0AAN6PT49_9PEZI|nr:hypothetical protein C8A01DRAFT_31693 [Parachaetomium inaequale]